MTQLSPLATRFTFSPSTRLERSVFLDPGNKMMSFRSAGFCQKEEKRLDRDVGIRTVAKKIAF